MVNFRDMPQVGPNPDEARQDLSTQDAEDAATVVHLNAEFVAEQGTETAGRLATILTEVSGAHATDSLDVVKAELERRLAAAGIGMSSVELDRYAEQIARGATLDVASE